MDRDTLEKFLHIKASQILFSQNCFSTNTIGPSEYCYFKASFNSMKLYFDIVKINGCLNIRMPSLIHNFKGMFKKKFSITDLSIRAALSAAIVYSYFGMQLLIETTNTRAPNELSTILPYSLKTITTQRFASSENTLVEMFKADEKMLYLPDVTESVYSIFTEKIITEKLRPIATVSGIGIKQKISYLSMRHKKDSLDRLVPFLVDNTLSKERSLDFQQCSLEDDDRNKKNIYMFESTMSQVSSSDQCSFDISEAWRLVDTRNLRSNAPNIRLNSVEMDNALDFGIGAPYKFHDSNSIPNPNYMFASLVSPTNQNVFCPLKTTQIIFDKTKPSNVRTFWSNHFSTRRNDKMIGFLYDASAIEYNTYPKFPPYEIASFEYCLQFRDGYYWVRPQTVNTLRQAAPFLLPDSDCIEMFHGTTTHCVDFMCRLFPRLGYPPVDTYVSNEEHGAQFGKGLYVTPDYTIALAYACTVHAMHKGTPNVVKLRICSIDTITSNLFGGDLVSEFVFAKDAFQHIQIDRIYENIICEKSVAFSDYI